MTNKAERKTLRDLKVVTATTPRRRRRRWLWLCAAVLSTAIAVASWLRVRSDLERTELLAEVTQVADVEVRYAKPQWETISPLCGCVAEQASSTWRGISFVARDIAIERTGEFPTTAYTITSPMPGMISWAPDILPIAIRAYAISVPYTQEFNPRLVATDPGHYAHRKGGELTPDLFFTLQTDAAVHVRLLGDTPMGAWIPTSASTFTLPSPTSTFARARRAITFQEVYAGAEYQAVDRGGNSGTVAEPAEYPLVDFLGPLVLWTEDKSAAFLSHKETLTTEGLPEGRNILAVVVEPPFATRLTVQPMRRESAESIRSLVAEGKELGVWYGDRDNGQASVTIDHAFEQSAEFQEIYSRLAKADMTVATLHPLPPWRRKGEELEGIQSMQMRYPPLPPNRGFNIFGDLSSLKLGRAKARLSINGRETIVDTPSDILMSDIQGFGVHGGALMIPLELDSSKRTVDLLLQGSATVKVGGRPIEGLPQRFRPHLDWTELLLSIAASTVAVIAFIVSFRRSS